MSPEQKLNPQREMRIEREVFRAIRSYVWNERVSKQAADRLEKARATIANYGLLQNAEEFTLGRYKVTLIEGRPEIEVLPPEGWEQKKLPGELGGEDEGTPAQEGT